MSSRIPHSFRREINFVMRCQSQEASNALRRELERSRKRSHQAGKKAAETVEADKLEETQSSKLLQAEGSAA